MKGIIFSEFIEMVEKQYGIEVMDEIITAADLQSKGAYTVVGTYDYKELFQLLHELSLRTKIPTNQILISFGRYIFWALLKEYPHFFNNITNTFDFLDQVDGHIHVQVKKIYPDAELPKFDTKRISDSIMELEYNSKRKMAGFALGMIQSVLAHYEENATIEEINLKEDGTSVKFILKKYE